MAGYNVVDERPELHAHRRSKCECFVARCDVD
jgi:hypothetical protein